jgi:hypothetical protein
MVRAAASGIAQKGLCPVLVDLPVFRMIRRSDARQSRNENNSFFKRGKSLFSDGNLLFICNSHGV